MLGQAQLGLVVLVLHIILLLYSMLLYLWTYSILLLSLSFHVSVSLFQWFWHLSLSCYSLEALCVIFQVILHFHSLCAEPFIVLHLILSLLEESTILWLFLKLTFLWCVKTHSRAIHVQLDF